MINDYFLKGASLSQPQMASAHPSEAIQEILTRLRSDLSFGRSLVTSCQIPLWSNSGVEGGDRNPEERDQYTATLIVRNDHLDDLQHLHVEVSATLQASPHNNNVLSEGWLKIRRFDEQTVVLFDDAIDGMEALSLVRLAGQLDQQQIKRTAVTNFKVKRLFLGLEGRESHSQESVEILSDTILNNVSTQMAVDRIIELLRTNEIPYNHQGVGVSAEETMISINIPSSFVDRVIEIGKHMSD